jgi:hypothetical protein
MSKIILFISAFVPMYILFLINLIVELINKNLTFNITNTSVLVGLILLILFGTFGLLWIVKLPQHNSQKVTVVSKINLTDQHFLNYFSLFVLLALAFDLSKLCFVCVFVLILIFIGIVYIRNNIFYINPMLNILGYSFYDIVFMDSDGQKNELRIFFKGDIKCGKEYIYELHSSNRNLNFLKVQK